ncbi:MAG TPA: sigma-E factor negative regulatory protein [Burkholderiaceae bacterium]|nr:sigma-E factor negative regulatory protein [Burkholderiaceae bacterium]
MKKVPSSSPAPCDAETLSSLMDGEVVDSRDVGSLIAAVCANAELRAEWVAFHLVGDALRSTEVASAHSSAFCTRVAESIAREPAIVAPRMTSASPLRRYLVSGIAVAASVAVIGFVAVPLIRNTDSPPTQQATVKALQPVAVASAERPDEAAARRAASTVANARALQAYLAAHRELTSGVALPRATPYLRATADQAEGR